MKIEGSAIAASASQPVMAKMTISEEGKRIPSFV